MDESQLLIEILQRINDLATSQSAQGRTLPALDQIAVCERVNGILMAFSIVQEYATRAVYEKSHANCNHCTEAGGD